MQTKIFSSTVNFLSSKTFCLDYQISINCLKMLYKFIKNSASKNLWTQDT